MVARIVVVPAAPALLPGLGSDVAPGYQDLLAACDATLATALAAAADVVLVAAADPPRRDLVAPAAVGAPGDLADQFGGLARPDRRTGWLVAAHLLDRAGCSGRRRLAAAEDGDLAGERYVVVAADGSAAVGSRSPRAGADGGPFDEHVAAALRTGTLADLDAVTDTAAARVGCVTAPAWRAVARAAGHAQWDAGPVHQEAPYGVISFVADFVRSR